jgi:hypothetical protein
LPCSLRERGGGVEGSLLVAMTVLVAARTLPPNSIGPSARKDADLRMTEKYSPTAEITSYKLPPFGNQRFQAPKTLCSRVHLNHAVILRPPESSGQRRTPNEGPMHLTAARTLPTNPWVLRPAKSADLRMAEKCSDRLPSLTVALSSVVLTQFPTAFSSRDPSTARLLRDAKQRFRSG